MCNKCGFTHCNCYPSVPNYNPMYQVSSCRPAYFPSYSCSPSGLNLLYARVATINTEFFQMPATPKTLIGAPGAGKVIVPLQIWNIITVSNPAIPYQDALTLTPQLIMSLGTFGIVSDASILGSLADQTTYYPPFSGTVSGNLANQPLTLSTNSQPVVGDSVLYSYIVYTIVNI